MTNVNGSTIPVFKVQEHTIENINVIQYKISSEPIPKYNMDADAVLKLVNFYRRAYNSPDAKWSKSKEDLAQKATRHNCNLGKLEHTVKCYNTSSFQSVFHISGTSNILLPGDSPPWQSLSEVSEQDDRELVREHRGHRGKEIL